MSQRGPIATAAWIVFLAVVFAGWGFILLLMIVALS